MEVQIVVVIHDASREVNSRVFEWALHGLSLKPGDMVTLVAVMHEIITPMGYKISVDNRITFGADKKVTDAQVAKKKEEYMNNKKLAEIFELYKSNRVGFHVELATGSSPKAVALKSAMKLKATWMILDRKMKNDEEYFLRKLSCGISRIKSYNKIVRLRGPLDRRQETRNTTPETYTDSIPDMSTDPELFSIEIFSNSNLEVYHMRQEGQRKNSPIGEGKNPHQLNNLLACEIEREQQSQDEKHRGLEEKLKEGDINTTFGGSIKETQEEESLSTKVYQKSDSCCTIAAAPNEPASDDGSSSLPIISWKKINKRSRPCEFDDAEVVAAAKTIVFLKKVITSFDLNED
ncbi:hypothetical protein RIF29_17766 [Crotalaria pallida]|uniref:Uncharacterized protein n=1 Tax=Crotalaria pallida TaxID=3830 RepID=A0AAN9ID96_CROPI